LTAANRTKYLDFLGLSCIGAMSFGYIVFVRPFAELHIQFSFLNFPIFVGEILLFICLLLFLAKCMVDQQKIEGRHYVLICYFVFVLAKALWGYSKWGPLAFRHAALLYYPVFAVFGYYFFRADFYDQNKRLLVFLLIVLMFILQKESMLWPLSGFILGVVLVFSYSNKIVKYSLLLLLCCVAPFKFIIHNSRTLIVGHLASFVYLVTSGYFVSRVKNGIKWTVIAFVVVAGVITNRIVYRGSLSTFLNINEVLKVINRYDEIRRERLMTHQPLAIKVNLYNPESSEKDPQESVSKVSEQAESTKVTNGDDNLSFSSAGSLSKEEEIFWNKKEAGSDRSFYSAAGSMAFRYFIWQDMLREFSIVKPIWGFDFGKPLRSPSIEALVIGSGEWKKDGWIEAHNSFLHIIYRTGIVGVSFIIFIFSNLFNTTKFCIQSKSWIGMLLCAVIIQWFVSANFMPIFELPYTAIPIWSLYGMTLAYCGRKAINESVDLGFQNRILSQTN